MQLSETQQLGVRYLAHALADIENMWDEPEGFDYWFSFGNNLDVNLHNWQGTGLQCNVYAVVDHNMVTNEWVDIPMERK